MLATEGKEGKEWVVVTFYEIFVKNAQSFDLRIKTEFKRNNAKTTYKGTRTFTFSGPKFGILY